MESGVVRNPENHIRSEDLMDMARNRQYIDGQGKVLLDGPRECKVS